MHAWPVEWTDIDRENRTVRISHPVKGHNPRILPVSNRWLSMVETLPKRSTCVFAASPKSYYRNFSKQRRRIAHKLDNPRLLKVTFTTLRHFKGTTEYYRTAPETFYMSNKFWATKTSPTP